MKTQLNPPQTKVGCKSFDMFLILVNHLKCIFQTASDDEKTMTRVAGHFLTTRTA